MGILFRKGRKFVLADGGPGPWITGGGHRTAIHGEAPRPSGPAAPSACPGNDSGRSTREARTGRMKSDSTERRPGQPALIFSGLPASERASRAFFRVTQPSLFSCGVRETASDIGGTSLVTVVPAPT